MSINHFSRGPPWNATENHVHKVCPGYNQSTNCWSIQILQTCQPNPHRKIPILLCSKRERIGLLWAVGSEIQSASTNFLLCSCEQPESIVSLWQHVAWWHLKKPSAWYKSQILCKIWSCLNQHCTSPRNVSLVADVCLLLLLVREFFLVQLQVANQLVETLAGNRGQVIWQQWHLCSLL